MAPQVFTSTLPNGVKRTTTIINKNGWIKKRHSYEPASLQHITRQKINAYINNSNEIVDLPIPVCLQKELDNHYLGDKLYCNEVPIEYVEVNDYTEPFLNIGKDGRIYYQENRHVPEFAWEHNIVTHIFYILRCHDIPMDYLPRYCHECLYKVVKQPNHFDSIEYWCEETVVKGSDIIDEVFQVETMWCSLCKTTSLFYLRDYEDDGSMPLRYFQREYLLRRIPL